MKKLLLAACCIGLLSSRCTTKYCLNYDQYSEMMNIVDDIKENASWQKEQTQEIEYIKIRAGHAQEFAERNFCKDTMPEGEGIGR